MQNLNSSAKSRGVVIFATNTDLIDYVSIAEQNAKLIKHYLGLPTTIIAGTSTGTNSRFSTDTNTFIEWKNFGRYQAYEASPYDETILLDADYLIFDNSLLKLFETKFDYLLFNRNLYINAINNESTMGPHSLPYIWATAVLFRKSERSKLFFDLIAKIQRNYAYYRLLYNIQEGNYRNDYAFAIAHYIINGYTLALDSYAPWAISTVTGTIDSISINNNQLIVKTIRDAYVLPKQNLHVMSKAFLTSPQLPELVDKAINE